ncbi:AAA family ATPase [Burkholderia ubonensis]|uniref:nSTAND1 domain-containing NTPase n=1 Tax=Burkholderia ubonensis TaxID=101571 RepID=UPI00358F667D
MSQITPHNAFTPAKEVRDIDRFAGRQATLDALSNALQSEGAQIVLYGQRGIGKSSLSRVLAQIATDDQNAIARLSEPPHKHFDYLTVSITCDDTITNVEKLLLRILTDQNGLAEWIPFKVIEKKTGGNIGGELNVKIIKLSGKSEDSITERQVEVESDVTSTFVNACKNVVSSNIATDGLLLIIDEFDRIKNKTGVASILKSLGPEKVTFAFVGVASDINELIADHESVVRQLSDGAIPVPPMDKDELTEIITRAMASLDNKYSFDESATNWITRIARGHPFYVHLIGKHALLKAISQKADIVTEDIAKDALAEIAFKGSAPVQENLYKKSVGHSYVREHILKKFANVTADEIYTTDLYGEISREIGIDPSAISVYVGQLASEKYGAVIEKIRERYYQFHDSLFKAYAAARPFERKKGDKEEE